MRAIFQEELNKVKTGLIELMTEVTNAIERSNIALKTHDQNLAKEIVANDDKIDSLCLELDEMSINILATQQPVARDLRAIVSSLRMSSNIQRMGDLAKHVAQTVLFSKEKIGHGTQIEPLLLEMGDLVATMSKNALQIIENEDFELAKIMEKEDNAIDIIHEKIFEITLDPNWQADPSETVNITLVNRFYERFADHAVRIGAKMTYLATGDWS